MTKTMPTHQADLEIDKATHTIRLRRRFAAPAAQVFDAWIDPAKLARWWDPAGTPLAVCEIDARPGGAFRFVNSGHEDMPFTGTYTKVAPPFELCLNAMGATSIIRFNAVHGGTEMVMEMRCVSAEHLEQFIALGIAEGTGRTMDNLVAFVANEA